MSRETMMKKFNLKKEDFEPKANDDKQRIKELEACVLELAELLSEVVENG